MMITPEHFIQSIRKQDEEWKSVSDFAGRFWISNHGRIVSHDQRKNTIKLMDVSIWIRKVITKPLCGISL
jgi:hypothetical protein